MLRTVWVEDNAINYNLTLKNVKNINLRIKSDSSINVSAPQYADISKIDAFVISKKEYIFSSVKQYENSQEFKPNPKRYVSGESFRILGTDLQLKVIEDNNEEVYRDGVYLYLKVRNKNNFKRKQRMINEWTKSETERIYTEIASEVYKNFVKNNVPFPTIKIRNMSKRWGSCQVNKRVININSKLIEAPRNCIEYVFVHEFCHFVHSNHSKNFYTLLQTMLPDWKERKKLLEKTI